MSRKKIILLGATGEIGLYVTEYLQNKLDADKYELITSGRRKTHYFDRYHIPYIPTDIKNRDTLQLLPRQNVHAVILLAGILPARMRGYHPEEYIYTNILGTLNVLEYCKNIACDRILFTKSVSDYYGYLNPDETNYFSADLPIKYKYHGDHTIYAISKCTAAEMTEYYHQEFGLKNFIFRLPNIYCYSPEKYYYVNGTKVPVSYRLMIERACNGLDIELWGDPKKGRDIVYVKDFAQIIYKAVISNRDGGLYNIGSGRITNMEEQIRGIIDIFDERHQSKIIYCPEKRDCVNYWMDISKTVQELGYSPKYSYLDYLADYKKEMLSDRYKGL